MTTENPVRVVAAFQPSRTYGPDYIEALSSRLDAPLRVVQDSRWPGWWCKMAAFDPSLFPGPMLMIDLDTIPVGSIAPFLKEQPAESMMLRDFYTPHRPASGVMLITEADRGTVWKAWSANPKHFITRHKVLGDGGAIAEILKPRRFLQDEFPGLICSYKVDCQHSQPSGVSLICYHGNPRPRITGWDTGRSAHFMRRFSVPFPPHRALTLEHQLYGTYQYSRR